MKSCYVRMDMLTGVVELEAPDEIKTGDYVISEIDKGLCLGIAISDPLETKKEGLKKIMGKATEDEVAQYFSLKEKEQYALDFCNQKIKDMHLPMKLIWAEYLFGSTKLLFYFVSESRVDFRELVKELAKEFKVRIELRQVGVRDEAKIIGVADTVEAMTGARPYRPAVGIDKALRYIILERGRLFDPVIVDTCVKLFHEKNFSFSSREAPETLITHKGGGYGETL